MGCLQENASKKNNLKNLGTHDLPKDSVQYQTKQVTEIRKNRLLEDYKNINENIGADRARADAGNSRASRISGNRRFYGADRKKSASKSIQRGFRENSLSSLLDYTLKFLNDDMAIAARDQKPLIEVVVEDDIMENQS